MKKILRCVVALFFCISITPTPSHALFGMGDIVFDPGQTMTSAIEFIRDTGVDLKTAYHEIATELYQYKDEVMAIKGTLDDAEKIMRLTKQIELMLDANDIAGLANLLQEHSITLQELDLAKWLALDWDDFSIQQFMRVLQILSAGEAIGIYASEVDQFFSNKYEGWDAYKDQVYSTGMFMDKYSEWSVINRDTIKAALKTIGIQAEEVTSEEDLMAKLRAKSSTAEGNMQIIQVSNDIASVGVGQMQKMRQLLMAQTQMQAAFYASQQDESDLLNSQAISHNMREYHDGLKPILGNDNWDDSAFKMEAP